MVQNCFCGVKCLVIGLGYAEWKEDRANTMAGPELEGIRLSKKTVMAPKKKYRREQP